MAEPRRTVTAVREARGGRVAVELDGDPWREVPVDAAARAGLAVGIELDRERLRTLARELRRARALDTALGALRRRDLSRGALEERLARSGVRKGARSDALGALERVGLVDDGRVARHRAAALAERGWGDQAIRYRLVGERVEAGTVEAALGELEPESVRAGRIVTRRGVGLATARFLARRGFGEDVVEAVAGDAD